MTSFPVKTTIFYFSSTGNSLWIARTLARELGDTDVLSMVGFDRSRHTIDSQVIGLVFPVHVWGVPRMVLEFLEQLRTVSPAYIFAVACNAGQVSNTLQQLHQVLGSRGLDLAAGWSVVLPSNYIPWGGPGSQEKQNELFLKAHSKLSALAEEIDCQKQSPVETGPLWQQIVFTWLYKLGTPRLQAMAKYFWVDDRCNQCGLCSTICPRSNIVLTGNKPVWQNHCDHCLACIQWCPQEAVQFSKKTPAYARYHHPEVKASDLV